MGVLTRIYNFDKKYIFMHGKVYNLQRDSAYWMLPPGLEIQEE